MLFLGCCTHNFMREEPVGRGDARHRTLEVDKTWGRTKCREEANVSSLSRKAEYQWADSGEEVLSRV